MNVMRERTLGERIAMQKRREEIARLERMNYEKERDIKTLKFIVKALIYVMMLICIGSATIIIADLIARNNEDHQALIAPFFAMFFGLPFVYLNYSVQSLIDKYTK